MTQLTFDFASRNYPGFDKFLGDANGELLYVLQQQQAPFVYVWGQKGSGKSHLLRAWVGQAVAAGHEAVYLDATSGWRQAAFDAEYLAVDQVDRLDETGQAELFAVFNRNRNQNRGLLLLSADVPPPQLAIREDLRTRMGYCLVYDVKPLNDQEKIDALTSMAHARQLGIDPEVFPYLLTHWRRDIDSLLSMLETLEHHSLTVGRRITLPLVRELLKQQENS